MTTATTSAYQTIIDQFTTRTRPNGDSYITCDEDSDARELVMHIRADVFGVMLPNDWVYAKTLAVLEMIDESDDGYETDVRELADIYTHDLYAWIAASHVFAGFVNDQMSFDRFDNMESAIIAGQSEALALMEQSIRDWMRGYIDTRS